MAQYELGYIEISMHNFVKICNSLNVDYAELLQNITV
ncbi:hypothetical protein [Pseudobutyrivibrio sp.]